MAKDISKNKVFASPYKNEIEKRLAIGNSPRAISKWLETRGEKISYATINEYKKEYFNIDGAAGKVVRLKQEETKNAVGETESLEELEDKQTKLLDTQRNMAIAEIRAVNHVAILYENIEDMRQYLYKLQSYDPIIAAHAAKGLYSEMRATIETLEKLKEKEGSDDDSSVAKALSQIKKHKRELEQSAKQSGQELE